MAKTEKRAVHPNSIKALEENRQKTQFSGERAVKASKKKHDNDAERKKMEQVVKELVEDKDRQQIALMLLKRSKCGNLKALELLLRLLGEMPAEQVDIRSIDIQVEFE